MRRPAVLCSFVAALLLAPGCAAQLGDPDDLETDLLLADTELMFPGRVGELGAGHWEIEGIPTELEYEDFEGTLVHEGDIVLEAPPSDDGELGELTQELAAVRRPQRWPNGVVPYEIAGDLPDKERVRAAIRHWNRNTPLRLVARTTQRAFVRFRRGPGCAAEIGYTGGLRRVWLHRACSTGNVIHEIGHVVGLFHEQSRVDRGDHIRIRWANVLSGTESNFRTYRALGVDAIDVGAYDTRSIMHYGSFAFSANGRPTIVRVGGGLIQPNRDRLSDRDRAGLARIY